MTEASADVAAVAQRLWVHATAQTRSHEDVVRAVERLFSQLRVGLLPWAGSDGYRALLDRAVGEVELQHPLLGGLSFLGGEGMALDSVETKAVTIAVVAALIDVFGRYVGQTLAVRLVDQIDFSQSHSPHNKGIRGVPHV